MLRGHTLDIISLILIFVLTPILVPDYSKLFIWIIIICIISRSNLIYHAMNLEIHSTIIFFIAIMHGFWICVYIAIISTWITKTLSDKIGIYNPMLTGMDTIHMTFIAFFASFLTLENFVLPAVFIFLAAEFIREGVRFFSFHEHFIKYFIMGVFFMTLLYFVMNNFSNVFIQFVGG